MVSEIIQSPRMRTSEAEIGDKGDLFRLSQLNRPECPGTGKEHRLDADGQNEPAGS